MSVVWLSIGRSRKWSIIWNCNLMCKFHMKYLSCFFHWYYKNNTFIIFISLLIFFTTNLYKILAKESLCQALSPCVMNILDMYLLTTDLTMTVSFVVEFQPFLLVFIDQFIILYPVTHTGPDFPSLKTSWKWKRIGSALELFLFALPDAGRHLFFKM